MFSTYIDLKTMAVQNQDKTFENFESIFFFFESVLSSDNTDRNKNFLTTNFSQLILYISQKKISWPYPNN